MYRIPLQARLDILRIPREIYRYRAMHPLLIRSPKFALGKADEDDSYDPMSRPGVKAQLDALDALQGIMVDALKLDSFTQWVNSKEEWEEIGITNCTDPVETYLRVVISRAGYKVRVYTRQLNPVDNTVSVTASGEYQINAWAQEIEVTYSGVCLDGFEFAPPPWATFFMQEFEKLSSATERPNETTEERVPVTKGECLAILARIPV